jgi:hypothetical protein
MTDLPTAVTAAKAVTAVVADHTSSAASEVATSWIAAHPEWSGPIALLLFVAAMAVAWIKGKAAGTKNTADDLAADVLAQTVAKTQAATQDKPGSDPK